ncbi:MAG TPA: hypothetical protein VK849_08700 [Longimicrobiales bacterium]|nr:hypothetical protein [Longimicrobiales bacterium]
MRSRLLTGILLMGLAACGGDGAPPEDEGADVTMASAAPREVRFTATDFAFEGPATVESGMTTLVLANQGETLHHLQLVRLSDGKSTEDFMTVMGTLQPGDPLPEWAAFAGGVNPPDPGAEARVTMLLEAGEYAVICLVDTPDFVPHLMKGMVTPLTVTASSAPATEAPATDLALTMTDYAFAFSAPLTAGQHVIRVDNAGPQPHEIVFFRLHEGKTMDDFMQFSQTYEGPLPASAVGGVPGMDVGQVAYVHVDFTPGEYVALCFFPDSGDGKIHAEHGMVMQFQVS